MADRMFDYFNHDGRDDITKTEWVSGLQIIMKGTEKQQAELCFQVKIKYNKSLKPPKPSFKILQLLYI